MDKSLRELRQLRDMLILCGEDECVGVEGYAAKLRALIDGLIIAKRKAAHLDEMYQKALADGDQQTHERMQADDLLRDAMRLFIEVHNELVVDPEGSQEYRTKGYDLMRRIDAFIEAARDVVSIEVEA